MANSALRPGPFLSPLGPVKQTIFILVYGLAFATFVTMQLYVKLQKYWLFQQSQSEEMAGMWTNLNSYLAIFIFCLFIFIAARLPDIEEHLYLAQHMLGTTVFFVIVPLIIIIKNKNLKLHIYHQLSKNMLYNYMMYITKLFTTFLNSMIYRNQIHPNI